MSSQELRDISSNQGTDKATSDDWFNGSFPCYRKGI